MLSGDGREGRGGKRVWFGHVRQGESPGKSLQGSAPRRTGIYSASQQGCGGNQEIKGEKETGSLNIRTS